MKINWKIWNDQYLDTQSHLNKRLSIVKKYINFSIKESNNPRILSICSGEGNDILSIISEGNKNYLEILLVDNDKMSIDIANDFIKNNKIPNTTAIEKDAGFLSSYNNFTADILIAVGFLGHLSFKDIENTLLAIKKLMNPGCYVIWSGNKRTIDCIEKSFINNGYTNIDIEKNISEKNHIVGLSKFNGTYDVYESDYIFTYNYDLSAE